MAFYQSYHRTPGCKATHFFGVPLVTFSILVPMGWLHASWFGQRATLAMAFVLATLVYYFLLDALLATLMTMIMAPVLSLADWSSRLPFRESLWVFLLAFAGGWVFQILGHIIEGKRPALLDNFTQAVFTAPLFLLAEALMAFGWTGPTPRPKRPGQKPG